MYKPEQIDTGNYGVEFKAFTFWGKIISIFSKPHTINFAWGTYEGMYGLWVFEMKNTKKEKDCKRTLYINSEYFGAENWKLFKYKRSFTYEEKKRFVAVLDYAYANFSYDKVCLIRHLIEFFTGRFPKEHKKDKSIVCSQLTALAVNNAVPYTFFDPELVSPSNCWENKSFKKVKPLKYKL